MRGYGAGIDPITSGHFPFRDKLCMFIGDYDMFPVKIEVILDFKTDPLPISDPNLTIMDPDLGVLDPNLIV